jgi:hypothetical protein
VRVTSYKFLPSDRSVNAETVQSDHCNDGMTLPECTVQRLLGNSRP